MPNWIEIVLPIIWIAPAIHSIVTYFRLMTYLKENHPGRYQYLTTVWDDKGRSNANILIHYVFSDLDNDDPLVVELRKGFKRSLLYFLIINTAPLVLGLLYVLISAFFRSL